MPNIAKIKSSLKEMEDTELRILAAESYLCPQDFLTLLEIIYY